MNSGFLLLLIAGWLALRTQSIPALLALLRPSPAGYSPKLRSVLDRHRDFYQFEYATSNEENSLSQNQTKAVEDVRSVVANLLGASSPEEIVFLRSATEAMNLASYAFERSQLQPGDEIVVTEMEHKLFRHQT